MGLFNKLKKNKETEPAETKEVEAIGWKAIEEEFLRVYPGQVNPKHYGTIIKWMLGGKDPLDGISVYWYMKTSTNLVTDAAFSTTRDSASGLSPTFSDHPMPDKPTADASQTADTLFYRIKVSFVAEGNEGG